MAFYICDLLAEKPPLSIAFWLDGLQSLC